MAISKPFVFLHQVCYFYMIYHYNWSENAGDNSRLRGEPDHSLFNRSEGYEVLYIINNILIKKGLTSIGSGNKAERLLREKLASKNYTQIEVISFFNKHW